MTTLLSDVKWGRTILAGIAPHAVWNVMFTVSITTGFQSDHFGTWNLLILVALLTFLAAVVVARTVSAQQATLHGMLVGLISAFVGLTFGMFIPHFVVTVAAGWLGGRLVQRL